MRLEGVGGLLVVFAGLKHRKKTVHTATPPTKQGKDNNFAIAAASQFKCTEELRSSDTHRQTEDCRCYPTEEPTKGEQSLLSSALISIIYCLESGSTGFGASGKRNKVISEGWVALFCRVKVGAASSLFGFVCSLLHVQYVRSINHATRDA